MDSTKHETYPLSIKLLIQDLHDQETHPSILMTTSYNQYVFSGIWLLLDVYKHMLFKTTNLSDVLGTLLTVVRLFPNVYQYVLLEVL